MLERDGSGKEVYLGFGNIATAKQMPYLIRGMNKIMPNLTYLIRRSSLQDYELDAFFRDLKKNDISFDNFRFTHSYPDILKVSLSYDNYELLSNNDRGLNSRSYFFDFPIDPLKFSERRILNDNEIGELKEKYKIRDTQHVVLGGSFHYDDYYFFDKYLNKLSGIDDFKFIVVPRNNVSSMLNFSKEKKIGYELDSNIKGNENVLFVEEKGVLDDLYSVCDVALIGSTFGGFGCGQNPLEPAFYSKKMIYGGSSDTRNREAFDGLEKSGLLKKITSPKKVVSNMLSSEFSNDLSSKERAFEFMKSWQGYEDIYANIVQKGLYNDFSEQDVKFLTKFNPYEDIKERFS